jgi:hypothetical protein
MAQGRGAARCAGSSVSGCRHPSRHRGDLRGFGCVPGPSPGVALNGDDARWVVSRLVAREPWNFSAGYSIKEDRRPDLVKDSRDWIWVESRVPRWAVGHRHERRFWSGGLGIEYLYPPHIRGWTQWQQGMIKGGEQRRNHDPERLKRRRLGRYRRSGSSRMIRVACGSTSPIPPRTARMPPVNCWRPPKPTRSTGTE